ncbi:MAG: hypothetical protein LAT55_10275 [Opitutales bacterium]|nr:hypothetical protein [Opitutales bacterium]
MHKTTPQTQNPSDQEKLGWLKRVFTYLGWSFPEAEEDSGNRVGSDPRPLEEASPKASAPDQQIPESSAVKHGTETQAEPSSEGNDVPDEEQKKIFLNSIRKFASWDGADGEKNLAEAKAAMLEVFPESTAEIDAMVTQGKGLRKAKTKLYGMIMRKGPESDEVKQFYNHAREQYPWADFVLRKTFKNTINRKNKVEAEKTDRRQAASGKPVQRVKLSRGGKKPSPLQAKRLVSRRGPVNVPNQLHPSDVRNLPPSSDWLILIDETGSEFGPDADTSNDKQKGKFVALVIPGKNPPLKPLPRKWHATDCDNIKEIDEVFQAVLDAEVGILGLAVDMVPHTGAGERWMDGVGLLLDWALRLLPVEGATRIHVQIENRGRFDKNMKWDLVERDCLRRMALAYPAAAAWIDLHIETIGKDGSPLNGYVDALAYTWARSMVSSKERLKQSQLLGTCLWEGNARAFLSHWDAYLQGVSLPETVWWEVLNQSTDPASLPGTLLQNLGIECRENVAHWERYLNETRRQMAMAPVELSRLGAAVDWLQKYQPAGTTIPPRLRMSWLTVRLANQNHRGETVSAWEEELTELGSSLMEEAAPAVCHADLHLAVARTNRFDFVGAGRPLEKWKNLPVAVPGLQYWGQIQSSLGQHRAFLGEPAEAVTCFDQAMKAFDRLSDPALREKEKAQTGCYRAIALMDDPAAEAGEVRRAVEAITGPLPKAAARLAASRDPHDRYRHHLLLRWLVFRGDTETAEAYLREQKNWVSGEAHPWPHIEGYRGLLLREQDPAAAVAKVLSAAELAFASRQGPVLRFIGSCWRTIAADWGKDWPDRKWEIESLAGELSFAGDFLQALEAGLTDHDPQTFLKHCLPFNFR